MSRVGIAVLCLAASMGFALAASAQAPGEIPDPSSYAGSMALQQQERERAQQVQQQNDAMLQRLDQNYKSYAPTPGGGAGGGRAAPQINWRAKPPLPAAKNPLLGRWRHEEATGMTGRQIGSSSPLASLLPSGSLDIAAGIINGAMAGGCESMFGKGVVAFEPTALQWVAPDGHEEILDHVEYRADGANVVVLSNDPGAVPWLIFGFPSHDHAVVALLNCTMSRVSATKTNAPRPAGPSGVGPVGLPATRAGNGSLSVKVGVAVPGNLIPIGGAVFYVVTHDPDAALAQAGFGGGRSPIDAWFAACRTDQERCKTGIRAMTAGALGNMRTDVAGNAEIPQLPSGRYYLVGHATYQGREIVWHRPIEVQPGRNSEVLDQTNGSVGG